MFHGQEKVVSTVSCRRCVSWQNGITQWELSHGVWVILLRSPKGSGRLCNTCRFPEQVVGCFLFLIVLYRVWYFYLRVVECLLLPGIDIWLEQCILHVYSLLYFWGAVSCMYRQGCCGFHQGVVTQLRQVGMGMAVSCSREVHPWSRAPLVCSLFKRPGFGSS